MYFGNRLQRRRMATTGKVLLACTVAALLFTPKLDGLADFDKMIGFGPFIGSAQAEDVLNLP